MEWRECQRCRNSYEVSSTGQVRSLNYNKTGQVRDLSQKLCGKYLAVSIDNKRQTVHRLVAEAFIRNPDNLPEVDHINRDKTDNNVSNLRWASKSLNAINRVARQTTTGYNNIQLTEDETYRVDVRRKDRSFRKTFKTLAEAVEARDDFLE